MSQQYDVQPGVDLSGLASVSQSEIMQAISQIAPLSNIGGIIYQAATTAGNNLTPGSNGAPDVPSNDRFKRYIWLNTFSDPPTQYTYKIATDRWVLTTVGDGSVDSDKLALNANSVAIQHMLNNSSGVVPTSAHGSKVLVYDSSGQYIVQLSRSDFMSGFTISTSGISAGGGSSTLSFIRYNGGTPAWGAFDPSADVSNGTIPLAKLAAGAANYLMRAGAGGIPEFVTNDDASGNWLPAGSLLIGVAISKLKIPTSTAYSQVRVTSAGTAMEAAVDPLMYRSGDVAMSVFTQGVIYTTAPFGTHAFGATADIYTLKLLSTTGGASYGTTTYFSANALLINGTDEPALIVTCGPANIGILLRSGTYDLILGDGTIAANVTQANLTATYGLKVNLTAMRFNRA